MAPSFLYSHLYHCSPSHSHSSSPSLSLHHHHHHLKPTHLKKTHKYHGKLMKHHGFACSSPSLISPLPHQFKHKQKHLKETHKHLRKPFKHQFSRPHPPFCGLHPSHLSLSFPCHWQCRGGCRFRLFGGHGSIIPTNGDHASALPLQTHGNAADAEEVRCRRKRWCGGHEKKKTKRSKVIIQAMASLPFIRHEEPGEGDDEMRCLKCAMDAGVAVGEDKDGNVFLMNGDHASAFPPQTHGDASKGAEGKCSRKCCKAIQVMAYAMPPPPMVRREERGEGDEEKRCPDSAIAEEEDTHEAGPSHP